MPGPRTTSSGAHPAADIALVISDMGDGGAQRVLATLARQWCDAGRRVAVVTQAGPEDDFFDLPAGVRRIVAGGLGASPNLARRLTANLRRIGLLRRAIRAADAPVVVAFVGRTLIVAIIACVGLQLRLVICERNDPARQSLGPAWDVLRRLLYRRADVVTANSAGAIAALAAFVPAAKLRLVPNPVAAPAPAPPAQRAPLFLSVGRLTHQKGYDVLLDAFARAAGALPGWRLRIIGRGELQASLQAQAAALRIDGCVDWPGLVADPAPHYAEASVFVLSSRFEGMPNVLLEAMNHGMAVIVTDASPGPLEHVEDGVSGLVVPAGDADRLAQAMARLAGDADLRRCLGAEASRRMAALRPDRVIGIWEAAIGLSGDADPAPSGV